MKTLAEFGGRAIGHYACDPTTAPTVEPSKTSCFRFHSHLLRAVRSLDRCRLAAHRKCADLYLRALAAICRASTVSAGDMHSTGLCAPRKILIGSLPLPMPRARGFADDFPSPTRKRPDCSTIESPHQVTGHQSLFIHRSIDANGRQSLCKDIPRSWTTRCRSQPARASVAYTAAPFMRHIATLNRLE